METLDTVATLEARGSEVRELVQEGEIDLAVRRLLDLAKDFAPIRELRNETLSVSAKHNSLSLGIASHARFTARLQQEAGARGF
jgi:hypothetical protein